MSWITRCPACGVTYQVVSDQLKIAQGWLRCGQCRHAFDSTGMALPWPVEAEFAAHEVPAEVPVERLALEDLLKHEDRPVEHTPVAAFEEAVATFPQPLTPIKTVTTSEVFGVPLGDLLTPHAETEDVLPALTPQASTGWPWLVSGCLLLALALQWVVIGRHQLVAAEPALTVPVAWVCRLLGCDMAPLAVRDGVVIENSSMTPRDGGLALLWTVRNVSPKALEMPALELTWLDAQDKVLVRRVLRPSEQNAPPALAPGQVWSGQLQLLPVEGLQPMGYRLVNFYP